MKKLKTSNNKVALYVLQDQLEEQGIATLFKNEHPPLAGEIPPMLAPPEIWVMQDEDFPRALEVMEGQEKVAQTFDASAWQCAQCQEENEGQFAICWQCEHART